MNMFVFTAVLAVIVAAAWAAFGWVAALLVLVSWFGGIVAATVSYEAERLAVRSRHGK